MKILVATRKTQGERNNDFCFAKSGEIVRFCCECDGEDVDGPCGCRRSLVGVETGKATTTFQVVEKNLTVEEFGKIIKSSFERSGWQIEDELIQAEVSALTHLTESFKTDVILEKRGDIFQQRRHK